MTRDQLQALIISQMNRIADAQKKYGLQKWEISHVAINFSDMYKQSVGNCYCNVTFDDTDGDSVTIELSVSDVLKPK